MIEFWAEFVFKIGKIDEIFNEIGNFEKIAEIGKILMVLREIKFDVFF